MHKQLSSIIKNKNKQNQSRPQSIANRRQKQILNNQRLTTQFQKNNAIDNFHLFEHCKNEEKRQNYYYERFLFGETEINRQNVYKFLSLIYQGLNYSSLILKPPNQESVKNKMVLLPERQKNKKEKFLMLDLDETLIHLVEDDQPCEVQLQIPNDKLRINIRPFCHTFLQAMFNYYQIFVFTSAERDYAQTIVDYLNEKKHFIQGILSRQHCYQAKYGLLIKDLRIIKNRDLSQIVLVDNMVHSFGIQIENGIPILCFTNQKNDKELLGLEKMLIQLNKSEDVRIFLRDRLNLKACCAISQQIFTKVPPKVDHKLKKQKTLV